MRPRLTASTRSKPSSCPKTAACWSLRESGFPSRRATTGATWRSTFPTSLTPQALARFEQREELAAASALRHVLYPRSVAVIGASEKPGAVGTAVVRNLRAAAFPGPIYPVNPSATTIQSLPAFASVEDDPRARSISP